MKKLMITAAAVAMTAGAFATPAVYDFKASVKHMYLKEVRVNRADIPFNGFVYQKYQKSASLKGYLIQDMDGVTSPSITGSAATSADFGRSRSFLVVQNSGAERDVRAPKILPAVLDAKYLDTRFTATTPATTGLAEGYLFVGGDSITSVRPQIDRNDAANVHEDRTILAPWNRVAPAASTAGIVAYSDYVWTSVYLFGQYNGPNWYGQQNLANPFFKFEDDWDANLHATLQRTVEVDGRVDVNADGVVDAGDLFNYYHDTWMNGAGIGKYFTPTDTGSICCGLQRQAGQRLLDTLSGNLKGGVFICTENGIAATGLPAGTYDFFDGNRIRWEDQFVAERIVTPAANGLFTAAGDRWQNDLWQDGAVDQPTTDVVYGTWSIKYNRTFFNQNGVFERNRAALEADGLTVVAMGLASTRAQVGMVVCAAARALDEGVNVFDGTEIYLKTADNRFDVPMLTPKFITYYGL